MGLFSSKKDKELINRLYCQVEQQKQIIQKLHRHFADKAVNKVNPRKEFFNVSIDEIEKIVKMNYNETVQFTKIPIVAEYRQSVNM